MQYKQTGTKVEEEGKEQILRFTPVEGHRTYTIKVDLEGTGQVGEAEHVERKSKQGNSEAKS